MDQPFIQIRGPPPPGIRLPGNLPPPPPKDSVPLEFRNNRSFMRVSDISREFMSDNDMRESLTEYLTIRIEKIPEKQYSEYSGQPMRSSWERAITTEVRGLSNRDIAYQIRALDASTGNVMDKKNALNPILQRQIDIAIEQIISADHDSANFQWVLAQMEDKLVPLSNVSTNKRHDSSGHSKKSNSSSKAKAKAKKRVVERVALTAYFKRVPRQTANIAALCDTKKRAIAMMPHLTGPMPGPFAGTGPGHGHGLPPRKKSPQILGNDAKNKGKGNKNSSNHGSESSSYSGCSDSDDTYSTIYSQSQSTDSSRPGRRGRHQSQTRRRNRSRSRNNIRYYEGHSPPRIHLRAEPRYILDGGSLGSPRGSGLSSTPVPPPAPPPVQVVQTGPSGSDIDKLKDAYISGRADERARQFADGISLEARPWQLPPRVIQQLPASPTGVRTIAVEPPRYVDDDLRFDRLSIDNLEYEQLRREEEARCRRSYGADLVRDLHEDEEDYVREAPFVTREYTYGDRGRRASDYTRRHEEYAFDRNPFSPLPKREGPYGGRRY